jgi:hypothetical protein
MTRKAKKKYLASLKNLKANEPPIEAIVEALKESGGIFKQAEELLRDKGFSYGIGRHRLSSLYNTNDEIKQAVQEGVADTCDLAHGTIRNAIERGDIDTSKWYLSKLDKRFQNQEAASGALRIILEHEVIDDRPNTH